MLFIYLYFIILSKPGIEKGWGRIYSEHFDIQNHQRLCHCIRQVCKCKLLLIQSLYLSMFLDLKTWIINSRFCSGTLKLTISFIIAASFNKEHFVSSIFQSNNDFFHFANSLYLSSTFAVRDQAIAVIFTESMLWLAENFYPWNSQVQNQCRLLL